MTCSTHACYTACHLWTVTAAAASIVRISKNDFERSPAQTCNDLAGWRGIPAVCGGTNSLPSDDQSQSATAFFPGGSVAMRHYSLSVSQIDLTKPILGPDRTGSDRSGVPAAVGPAPGYLELAGSIRAVVKIAMKLAGCTFALVSLCSTLAVCSLGQNAARLGFVQFALRASGSSLGNIGD